jgi:hypothetical protein
MTTAARASSRGHEPDLRASVGVSWLLVAHRGPGYLSVPCAYVPNVVSGLNQPRGQTTD